MCRILGRGRSGTVFLARHRDLEEYRAIKQVPKTCVDYRQFRREALILKSIRHPGIPIVYDLEEDEKYSYLIEEYLEGETLYALVSDMGHFSTAMTIRYGIQICHLVSILHSARPYPILYLDLQPKNLLVSQDTVKLIDFDHALHLCEAEHLTKRYGTVGCAAPEQYSGDILDERTDIYAIGAVLHYMLTGRYPGEGGGSRAARLPDRMELRLMRVIRICMQEEKARRYQSTKELGEELEKLEAQIRKKEGQKGLSSLTIAVAGSQRGIGCTHIAMGLTAYLRQSGISAMYEERNDTGAVRQFAACSEKRADQFGMYRIRGVPMLPEYGECVRLTPPSYHVRVLDYGTCRQRLLQEQADVCLLVCGAKPWELEASGEAIQSLKAHLGLAVIYNQFCGQLSARLPAPARGTVSLLMPHYSNPFECRRAVRRVYDAALGAWLEDTTGGKLLRLFGRGRGRAARQSREKTGGP